MGYYGTMQPLAPAISTEQPMGDKLLSMGIAGVGGKKPTGGNNSEILKMLAAMGGNGGAPVPPGAAQPGIDAGIDLGGNELRPMVDPGFTGLPPGTLQSGGQSGVLEALLRRLNPRGPQQMPLVQPMMGRGM